MAATRSSENISAAAIGRLPLTIETQPSISSAVFAIALILVSAGTLLLPFGLIATAAAADPAIFLAIAQQPGTAIQLAAALLLGIGFVAIPLRRVVRQMRAPQRIVVSQMAVSATTSGKDGATGWREPLSAYRGVAHHVRSSLSGARHEIVLVHDEPSKSVVLLTADRVAQHDVDAISSLLNVPEIPARAMYDRASRAARPITELQAA